MIGARKRKQIVVSKGVRMLQEHKQFLRDAKSYTRGHIEVIQNPGGGRIEIFHTPGGLRSLEELTGAKFSIEEPAERRFSVDGPIERHIKIEK